MSLYALKANILGHASAPVSGKRRMTPTSMTPPPVPKKPKREPSPIRPSSPMDVEPPTDDEPVAPATYLETKAKELSHQAAGLEYPPPEYNLEGKNNRNEATGVGVFINPWPHMRLLTSQTSVAGMTKKRGNSYPTNSCPACPTTVALTTATPSTNCYCKSTRK